jgi:hypothetical protein
MRSCGVFPWFRIAWRCAIGRSARSRGYGLLVAAVVLVALVLKDLVMVAVGAMGPPIALFLAGAVGKPLVAGPEFGAYGFPSGHTTATAALGDDCGITRVPTTWAERFGRGNTRPSLPPYRDGSCSRSSVASLFGCARARAIGYRYGSCDHGSDSGAWVYVRGGLGEWGELGL